MAQPQRKGSRIQNQLATAGQGGPSPLPRRVLSAELKGAGSAMEVLLAAAASLPSMNLRNKSTALHTIATKVGR